MLVDFVSSLLPLRRKSNIKQRTDVCLHIAAPECSNNPLGYKFSWSSRGVLLALGNDAKYYEDGEVKSVSGPELMAVAKPYYIYPAFAFVGYPNRDSSPYKERYHIPEADTIIRGSLRYGYRNISLRLNGGKADKCLDTRDFPI